MRRLACAVALLAVAAVPVLGAQSAPASPAMATVVATTAQAHAAPTAGAAAAGVARTVPVAVRAIARGTTLTPADYRVVTATVRTALRNAAAAESGWVTRRPIAAGEPLVVPAVGPPALVAAGQPVAFIAEDSGIRLSIRGTAATSGSLGDRVWVRLDAGRRLRGVVSAPATVRADSATHR